MADLEVKLDAETRQFLKRGLKLGDREQIFGDIEKRLQRVAQIGGGKAVRYATQRLRTRTGALRQTLAGVVIRVNGAPAVRIGAIRGPSLSYVGVQEDGGTIHMKDKALTFAPDKSPALTPAGVERYRPREYEAATGHKLRFVPVHRGYFIGMLIDDMVESKEVSFRGRDVATGRFKRDRATVQVKHPAVVYIMMSQVTLKGQHFIRDAAKDTVPLVGEAVQASVKEVLSGDTR